jgi:hypothetical protein
MPDRVQGRSKILMLKVTPGVRNEASGLAQNRTKRVHTVGSRSNPARLRTRDVLVIKDARKPDKIELGGKKISLSTDAGRKQLTDALELDGKQAKAVQQVLKNAGHDARDELAQLARVLSWAQAGKMRIRRVVLSGHFDGTGIRGNYPGERQPNGTVSFDAVAKLAKVFPKAAAGVKHLMVAACFHARDDTLLARMRKIFPNLVSVTGYAASAPGGESPSAKLELKNWSAATARGRTPKRRQVYGRCSKNEPPYSQRSRHRRYHGRVFTDRGVQKCP